MYPPTAGVTVIVGVVFVFCKIKLFPSGDLDRTYPGRLSRPGSSAPRIPPSAVKSVQDAPVPIGGLFTDNFAPVSKVMLPVVLATTVGSVGAGMATIGVIA
jgi:hypothetical protein